MQCARIGTQSQNEMVLVLKAWAFFFKDCNVGVSVFSGLDRGRWHGLITARSEHADRF